MYVCVKLCHMRISACVSDISLFQKTARHLMIIIHLLRGNSISDFFLFFFTCLYVAADALLSRIS